MDAVRGPKLRTVHHRVLLRTIGAQRKISDYWMTSYNRALEIIRCENIETCGEDLVRRRKSGPIAYRVTSRRLA